MKLTNAQRKIDTELRKNPFVQAAAIALAALNAEYPDASDEFAEKAGQILARCCSLMGLPSEGLTPKQQYLDDAVTEAIQELSTKMEAALIKARLLRSDCAEAQESQRKAA
jgi:hypothetical protein